MLVTVSETARDPPLGHGSRSDSRVLRAVVAGLLRVTVDHADVDDVVQEAERRALERPAPQHVPPAAWLLGIAKHVAVDALRRERRQGARRVAETPSSPDVADTIASDAPLPDARLSSRQESDRILRALGTLPPGTRRALELFYLHGKPYGEIASELGVPVGTVATWLLRGKRAMAEMLSPESKP